MSVDVKTIETTTKRASQIQTFAKKYWQEPFIITSGIQTGEITTQFILSKAESPAVKHISKFSQNDTNVSEAKMTNPEKDYAVKLVKMSSYFEDEKNQHNELVKNEKIAIVENGYNHQEDYYVAIPYPIVSNPEGLVFLFIKANEKEDIEEKLPLLCKKVEEVFLNKNP